MSDYDPKQDPDSTLRFLSTVLQKGSAVAMHVDTQSNILIGVDLAIFVYASSQSVSDPFFLALGAFAAASSLIALLAVHPPGFMRKHGQQESLLYHKRVSDFPSAAEYRKALEAVDGDRDALLDQFGSEIYNLYKFSYFPKRKLYKLARNLLLTGIVVSAAIRFAQAIA